MKNIGRTIFVFFVFTLLFSFQCYAEISYLSPFTGQVSSQPVSRIFTGRGSQDVFFPIPAGEWQQPKHFLEAVILKTQILLLFQLISAEKACMLLNTGIRILLIPTLLFLLNPLAMMEAMNAARAGRAMAVMIISFYKPALPLFSSNFVQNHIPTINSTQSYDAPPAEITEKFGTLEKAFFDLTDTAPDNPEVQK